MNNVCRVCLNKTASTNIFNIVQAVSISFKLMSFAEVQIEPNDGLPDKICSKCLKMLNNCYKFKLRCEVSDKKLRMLVPNNTSEIKVDDNAFDFEKNESCALFIKKSEIEEDAKEKIVIDIGNEIYDDAKSLCSDEWAFPDSTCKDVYVEVDLKSENKESEKKVVTKKNSRKQQCFTCGKVMSSRFRLNTHLKTHTGEKPYSCSECNKKFSSTQTLRIHMRTHTGEKPLQCSICGESFAHTAGLSAHSRKHTGEMPYHCSLCPRSFRTLGHYQYHVRWHTGEKSFECNVCSRSFITKSDLIKHLLIHSGERKHECTICGMKLTRSAHLKRHMLTHNKPFSCDKCDTKFYKKALFEKHKKKH